MTITRANATAKELQLLNTFKLDHITITESRDRYGKLWTIEELKTTTYKRDYDITLDQCIESYINAMDTATLEELKKIQEQDNQHADFMNMRQYDIVKVCKLSDGFYGLVLKFRDTGEIRNFVETGLSYAVKNKDNLKQYIERYHKNYWVAGGLDDEDADFIFHGVGHSTKKDLYTFGEDRMLQEVAL